jgi:Protein of unknown function (DUF3043)
MLAGVTEGPETQQPSGKGRPTPKRSDAQKRRRTATPTNRKEAAKLRRERVREERVKQRKALQSGDERYLPARDAGPAKRLARDYVDARFTLGQIFFIVVLAIIPVSAIPNRTAIAAANLSMLVLFLALAGDAIRVGRAARRLVEARHGAKAATGVTAYAVMRAMQPRRLRKPPPKIKRGDPIV